MGAGSRGNGRHIAGSETANPCTELRSRPVSSNEVESGGLGVTDAIGELNGQFPRVHEVVQFTTGKRFEAFEHGSKIDECPPVRRPAKRVRLVRRSHTLSPLAPSARRLGLR